MIIYTDKNGNVKELTNEELIKTKNSIYFTSLYTTGDKFRCTDEFCDYVVYILDVYNDNYKIKATDNWHLNEDIIDTLTIEELVNLITNGGY